MQERELPDSWIIVVALSECFDELRVEGLVLQHPEDLAHVEDSRVEDVLLFDEQQDVLLGS